MHIIVDSDYLPDVKSVDAVLRLLGVFHDVLFGDYLPNVNVPIPFYTVGHGACSIAIAMKQGENSAAIYLKNFVSRWKGRVDVSDSRGETLRAVSEDVSAAVPGLLCHNYSSCLFTNSKAQNQ